MTRRVLREAGRQSARAHLRQLGGEPRTQWLPETVQLEGGYILTGRDVGADRDERLLIYATNSVRALDSAFLRHGRFDYVIPVGPPDPAAREAIWDGYLAAIPRSKLDMAAIVEESRLFTPARHRVRRTQDRAACIRERHVRARRRRSDHGRHRARHRPDPAHPHPGTRAEFEQHIQDHARV